MHVVLHLGHVLPWGLAHSGHGDSHHSTVSHGHSELNTSLELADFSESSNHNHHTPSNNSPEPEDHDPTHHLTIQCRGTSQHSSVRATAILQRRFFDESITTNTRPSIAWTVRDIAVDLDPYVEYIRLIL